VTRVTDREVSKEVSSYGLYRILLHRVHVPTSYYIILYDIIFILYYIISYYIILYYIIPYNIILPLKNDEFAGFPSFRQAPLSPSYFNILYLEQAF